MCHLLRVILGIPFADLVVELLQLLLHGPLSFNYLNIKSTSTDQAPSNREVLDTLGCGHDLASAVQVGICIPTLQADFLQHTRFLNVAPEHARLGQ